MGSPNCARRSVIISPVGSRRYRSMRPDAGVAEAERAIYQLGALGVQIYTNVAGKPIDRPQYLPFGRK